jgi:hypothetical protein
VRFERVRTGGESGSVREVAEREKEGRKETHPQRSEDPSSDSKRLYPGAPSQTRESRWCAPTPSCSSAPPSYSSTTCASSPASHSSVAHPPDPGSTHPDPRRGTTAASRTLESVRVGRVGGGKTEAFRAEGEEVGELWAGGREVGTANGFGRSVVDGSKVAGR